MSTATVEMTTIAEFHALPENPELDRELIRGLVKETPATRRNKWHADVEAWIAHLLNAWWERRPTPRGRVFSGEIGCDLPDVEASVGLDVAYYSAETLAAQPDDAVYLVGPPVLAVEVLSPSDTVDGMLERLQLLLDAGTMHVWFVEPRSGTVTVGRPDERPRMYSGDDELSADPHLPGFTLPVSRLFDR